jgi:beta-lactamase class C
VAGSIRDLGSYLQAHLAPPAALSKAIGVATAEQATGGRWPVGLGWVHKGGGLWHNGATGGFRSFVAFHPPTKTAVAILVNGHDAELIDGVGFEVLTRMVGSRT